MIAKISPPRFRASRARRSTAVPTLLIILVAAVPVVIAVVLSMGALR